MHFTPRSAAPSVSHWFTLGRMVLLLVLLMAVAPWLAQAPFTVGQAQESNPPADATLEDVEPGAVGAPAKSRPASSGIVKQRTFWDTLKAGGVTGLIIILLSFVAVGFMIEHSLSIRKSRLMPDDEIDELQRLIAQGNITGAIEYCNQPERTSLASEVILAGLERYQSSEFGFAEYKSAVEEAGEESTARLYRKIDVLSVLGAIAPMLGLFGTVDGMMEAFNVMASTGGAAKPADLADSISKALVTTWLGLIVAIPSMAAYSFFRNKIDSLVSETGKRVEHVLMPLSRRVQPAAPLIVSPTPSPAAAPPPQQPRPGRFQ
jgi:biopolymer transport protein ExbB